jgi:hypothetical protein
MLAQQASGYDVSGYNFHIQERQCMKVYFFRTGTDQLAKLTNPVSSANSISAIAKSARPTNIVSQVDSSKSAKLTTLVGLANSHVTSSVNLPKKLPNQPNITSSDVGANLEDWRTPLLRYLRDPSVKIDKSVWRSVFKYVLHNDGLYWRTTGDLLLKCSGSDRVRMAMGEVYEGICGTHQSAPKIKWLLRRAGFYWPTMMGDCFCYYKGCEEC